MNFKHSVLGRILTCSHVLNEIRTVNPVRTVFLSSEHCSGTGDNLFNRYYRFLSHRQRDFFYFLFSRKCVIIDRFGWDIFIMVYYSFIKFKYEKTIAFHRFNFPIFEN